jgi:hypothetical protein
MTSAFLVVGVVVDDDDDDGDPPELESARKDGEA